MSKSKDLHADPLEVIRKLEPIECGEETAKHFGFEQGYRNLNHGSYGTYPIEVRSVFRHYQERTEAAPDTFVRYEYRTHILDESREAIAKYLHAPVETCVYVPNATTAFDTILRNLVFESGDVVVCFDMVYGSFENTLIYLSETRPVEIKKIDYTLPVSDEYLCNTFENTIKDLRAKGKNPRIAIFDTITSTPGVRMPFEQLTRLCKSHNVLSCIDGAHGIGQLPLNLSELDPDFFTSNCHKWLYVPRSCAVFYVPVRNQHLLRTTLPTGFAFVPQADRNKKTYPPGKSEFIANFASVGTLDDNPILCVQAGIEWRSKLVWGDKRGEEAAMGYMRDLARKGEEKVLSILQTESLENEGKTLGNCNFTNIRLPLSVSDLTQSERDGSAEKIGAWMMKTANLEYKCAFFVTLYAGAWWVRLSSQVYLTLKDFEYAAEILIELCERAKLGEWKT